jgi:hypothetical protein
VNEYVSGQKFGNYLDVMLLKFDYAKAPKEKKDQVPKGVIDHLMKNQSKIDASSEDKAKESIEKILEEYIVHEMMSVKLAKSDNKKDDHH